MAISNGVLPVNADFESRATQPSGLARISVGLLVLSFIPAGLLAAEPSYEQAVARWPDAKRPVTFLGCKDHPDEFGVMWNGNLSLTSVTIADADKRLFADRAQDSLQVSFSVGEKPDFRNRDTEDATTEASLAEGYLPIVQVQIRKDAATLLEEVFASNGQGSCATRSWDEPAYLHVRFTVQAAGVGTSPIRLWSQLAANHVSYEMETQRNIRILPVAPLYGRELAAEANTLVDSRGLAVMYADQAIHFHARLPEPLESDFLREHQLDRNLCTFTLPRQAGATLDLIFPFLPASKKDIEDVARLSYSEARQLLVRCWKEELQKGMQVSVPEQPVNNLWRFTVPAIFIAADSYPNGDKVLKDSAHHYEAIWGTGLAMEVFDLAQRGYFQEAAAYLEPFRNPATRMPVPNDGSSFGSTDGFIGDPAEYAVICWVSDHGAILWAVSEYYLLSRDRAFLERWLPSVLAGVSWIAKERKRSRLHAGPGAGLMPAGRSSDYDVPGQYFFSDAWTYRGLAAACRLLQAIDHPEATNCFRERDDYRDTFRKVFRDEVRQTMRWTDRAGNKIPFIPWRVGQVDDRNLHSFYLDTGPMSLGMAGLVNPTDETMTWAMQWLTEGPDSGSAYPGWTNFSQRPSLRYEMSSCEPSLSWNIYLRFLRDERERFLEGFYSLAAGDVSRKFLGAMETRDGVHDEPSSSVYIDNHLRNMLVFENEKGSGLDLLRNSPSAWLGAGKEVRVEGAQTRFGPMSFHVRSSEERAEVELQPPSRTHPDWIRLHLYNPDKKPVVRATVNGAAVPVLGNNTVEIRNPIGSIRVVAQFSDR